MPGLVHCYTGDGKGKTTAAMGLALRAAGHGKRVLAAQFLKDGRSGEIAALRGVPGVFILPCPVFYGFFRGMTDTEKEEAAKAYRAFLAEAFSEARAREADLLILDEAVTAVSLGLIPEEELSRLIMEEKPERCEVVLTGRGASERLISLCDYVTECRKVKHPYDRGTGAREGIEY